MFRPITLLLLGILCLLNDSPQAAPATPPASPPAEQSLTLNFTEADIRAFIGAVSDLTGRNFVVDPRVQG